jgi:hypothetical protein
MILTKQHLVIPVLVISPISSDISLVWWCDQCEYRSSALIDMTGKLVGGVHMDQRGDWVQHVLCQWVGAEEYLDKVSHDLDQAGL